MKNKKGISPLIATVLLIGFAVALAAIVMTWGLDFIADMREKVDKDTEEALMCANRLDFKISIDCTSNKVIIDNRGSIDIKSFMLRAHPTTGPTIVKNDLPGLLVGEKKEYTDLGNLVGVAKIDAAATIEGSEGNEIFCTNARREKVANCKASTP